MSFPENQPPIVCPSPMIPPAIAPAAVPIPGITLPIAAPVPATYAIFSAVSASVLFT